MRNARRAVAAITILVFGPLLGILAGGLVCAFALPQGYADGGRAPGDGFLIVLCIAVGFVLSIPVSIALVVALFRHPSAVLSQKNGTSATQAAAGS